MTKHHILAISKDMEERGIFAIALQETRWEEMIIKRRIGDYIWFGGGAIRNRAKARTGGIGIGVHQKYEGNIECFKVVSSRLGYLEMKMAFGRKLRTICIHHPIDDSDEVQKDEFAEQFKILMRDKNAKRIDVLFIGKSCSRASLI